MSTSPMLSVVIPTHNRKAMLREMLLSMVGQSLRSWHYEVIVVDDGSTDGTTAMLESLPVSYSLRVVSQSQSGPAAARNNGAFLSKGRALLFLDDDLLPNQELLAEHLKYHNEGQDTVVLGLLLPARGGKKSGWHIWEENVLKRHYKFMNEGRRRPGGRRLYSGNVSIGRDIFVSLKGFDVQLKRGEDVEFGFRLEQAGAQFYFNPKASAIHRGYRSFESWCQSAYLYGHTDVQLATVRGHAHALQEVFQWHRSQPALARLALGLAQQNQFTRKGVKTLLRAGSGILTRLRLHKAAYYGYTGIYRLNYWQGVLDTLGGHREFGRLAREFMRRTESVDDASYKSGEVSSVHDAPTGKRAP
jgi:glycosyltransferase involved in cell wall biosynthesis